MPVKKPALQIFADRLTFGSAKGGAYLTHIVPVCQV